MWTLITSVLTWTIKVVLIAGALKKIREYLLKTNIANILLFILESHKAGKKKKNANKRTSNTIQKSDTDNDGRFSDSKPNTD